MPGGVGSDGWTVSMTFDDATTLVPNETCRANDTVVGTVASVQLGDDLKPQVVCRIRQEVSLPANVEATLRETSLLGERYVSFDVPPGQRPRGTLAPGTHLPTSDTSDDPNTELVLGALSQVLNGGSLARIQSISHELNTALSSGHTKSAVRRLAALMASLNANRGTIVATLTKLDGLSRVVATQHQVLEKALAELPAGLAVLNDQRPRLLKALAHLSALSRTLVPLLQASRANTVADLRHLQPVLTQLAKAGRDLAPSLERLTSFPFNRNTSVTIKGDYSGAFVMVNLDLDTLNKTLADAGVGAPGQPGPGLPPVTIPSLPGPGLPSLPLPTLPLPSLPLPSFPGTLTRPATTAAYPGLDPLLLSAFARLADQLDTRSAALRRPARTLAELLAGPR